MSSISHSSIPRITLSDDILCKIFLHLLDESTVVQLPIQSKDLPWTLTQVCSQWRKVAFATSELWRNISIAVGRDSLDYCSPDLGKLVDSWFAYGGTKGGVALQVRLLAWEPTRRMHSEHLLNRVIIPRLDYRIRELDVRGMANDMETIFMLPQDTLCNLEKLSIDCLDPLHLINVPTRSFKAAPRLHSVRISSPGSFWNIDSWDSPWDKLQTALPLPWIQIRSLEFPRSVMQLRACLHVLHKCPNLEHFSATVNGTGHPKTPPPAPPLPPQSSRQRLSSTFKRHSRISSSSRPSTSLSSYSSLNTSNRPLFSLPKLSSLSLELCNHSIVDDQWFLPIHLPSLRSLKLSALHLSQDRKTIWPHKPIIEFLSQLSCSSSSPTGSPVTPFWSPASSPTSPSFPTLPPSPLIPNTSSSSSPLQTLTLNWSLDEPQLDDLLAVLPNLTSFQSDCMTLPSWYVKGMMTKRESVYEDARPSPAAAPQGPKPILSWNPLHLHRRQYPKEEKEKLGLELDREKEMMLLGPTEDATGSTESSQQTCANNDHWVVVDDGSSTLVEV